MPPESALVLVTGATGFVGRHLAPALAARGWRVRGTARRLPPSPTPGFAEMVAVADIGPDTDWSTALAGVQAVVHLAAVAHHTDPRTQPSEAEFMRVNAGGTRRLAEAMRSTRPDGKFVFVSSIGAVTEASPTPVDEQWPPAPRSAYGRSKLAGERAVAAAFAGSAVDWCILRPVLVYGAGNPGNMARLLRLVQSGLPLPLGAIRNARSFVYVGNLVSALAAALDAPGLQGRTFHVADDEVASTPELIRLIAAADQRPARLLGVPLWALGAAARVGDLARTLGLPAPLDGAVLGRLAGSLTVSNAALQAATGWRPPSTLAAGLAATLRGPTEASA